ncbi:MAG: uracil-DNA glycosylase [Deltaproteobacteria bacterium]|nr:uracil-DNA glycosylase [Deltaproteobacteria bacterium]MBW2137124.1 uracil-DNA glycosylase [Deltaproteobacteria bacterium]
MGGEIIDPGEEIREIFGRIKHHLLCNRDMGLEPPRLSRSSSDYLEAVPPRIDSLQALRNYIGECRRCRLYQGRTNLVFGEGSPRADLVFVGEGPGREEDQEGMPFVGEAGRLLTRIIKAMGLERKEVYICNVVKCRPPKNRDPEEDEIDACLPFLKKQIALLRPRVICTLGRIAAQALLGKKFQITMERGKWYTLDGIPLMPTYHPAYLLRNPSAKRQVWEDVKKVIKHMGLEVRNHGSSE